VPYYLSTVEDPPPGAVPDRICICGYKILGLRKGQGWVVTTGTAPVLDIPVKFTVDTNVCH